MNFLELIRDVIPEKCGVDAAYGKASEILFWRECEGVTEFNQDWYKQYGDMACRERVKLLYMPYQSQAKDQDAYEHYLDLLELVACYHRQNSHGGDWSERIDYLRKQVSEEENEFAIKGWWSS